MRLIAAFCLIFLHASQLFAHGEINISDANYEQISSEKFIVSAKIANLTKVPREVTLRAQLFFFEQSSPRGDRPAMILRKDATLVLKPRESRSVKVKLINEGSLPKAQIRYVPEVRLRRQRVWNY